MESLLGSTTTSLQAAASSFMANATEAANGTAANTLNLAGFPIPKEFATLFTVIWTLKPFGDWTNIFLLGGLVETFRRLGSSLWTRIVESFFLTATFNEGDEAFTWMMVWLSQQPSWSQARSLQVSTSRYGHSDVASLLPGEDEAKGVAAHKLLAFGPSIDKTHYIWFRRSWVQISRTRTDGDYWNSRGEERLHLTMWTRGHSLLNELLLDAKRVYKQESEDRIYVYMADSYNDWSLAGSKPKRPLSSVVLDQGVKEALLHDARDFMSSEKWYSTRGIPWRRGYLLYGAPGSGKTSLIHALAGELKLNIYVVSLSKRGLDDSGLHELISRLPSKSIALMEDIDAALYRGLTRENNSSNDTDKSGEKTTPPPPNPRVAAPPPATGVTLSGLLNAIDGVAAQEGRILFATTNKYDALDPALIRPGRLDVHVKFENAGHWQVEELYKAFYPPTEDDSENKDDNASEADDEKTLAPTNPPTPTQDKPDTSAEELAKVASVLGFAGSRSICPRLTETQVKVLAKQFSQKIPDREFSMAAIQGLLMQYKTRPYRVIEEVDIWMVKERERRKENEKKKAEEEKGKDKGKDEKAKDKADAKGSEKPALSFSLFPF